MDAFDATTVRHGGACFRDLETESRYLETFIVHSWAEHLRQQGRFTEADREIEERLHSYTRSQPTVRHLVSAK